MDKNRKQTSINIAIIPGKQEDRWPSPCVWRYWQELLDIVGREHAWPGMHSSSWSQWSLADHCLWNCHLCCHPLWVENHCCLWSRPHHCHKIFHRQTYCSWNPREMTQRKGGRYRSQDASIFFILILLTHWTFAWQNEKSGFLPKIICKFMLYA